MLIFTIYDNKSELYNNPFVQKTTGAAIRAFTSLVEDEQTDIARHPSDYELFEIGEFDPESGQISGAKLKNLGKASTFKNEL